MSNGSCIRRIFVSEVVSKFNPGINLMADTANNEISGIIVSTGLSNSVTKTATAATEHNAVTSKKSLGVTLII